MLSREDQGFLRDLRTTLEKFKTAGGEVRVERDKLVVYERGVRRTAFGRKDFREGDELHTAVCSLVAEVYGRLN